MATQAPTRKVEVVLFLVFAVGAMLAKTPGAGQWAVKKRPFTQKVAKPSEAEFKCPGPACD